MSKTDEVLQKAYGNMPKEVGFSDAMFDWFPTVRGIKYYWLKYIVRKALR
jgi:hypothetical protein